MSAGASSGKTTASLPGDLKLARPFWPVLPVYARNLLVGTDVGTRRDDDGKLLVGGKKLFMYVVDREIEDLEGETGPEPKVRRLVAAAGGRLHAPPRAGNPFRRNLRVVGGVAGLRRVERRVLEFLLAVRMAGTLEEVTDCFPRLTLEAAARLIAIATAEPLPDVRRALRPRGRLVGSGLVVIQPLPDFIERKLLVSASLPDLVMADGLERGHMLDVLAPAARASGRPWSELAPAVPGADLLRRVVSAAADTRLRGVNVLLHGSTGSGKSELARALARDLSLDLREMRPPDTGPYPSAESRIPMLAACDQLVRDGRSLFLFDAIEDVLEPHAPPGPGHLGARTSRAWLERRLERNAVPTIWTTTDASRIDGALMGRFRLVLEVPAPAEAARRSVWESAMDPSDHLSAADCSELAARFSASPAEIARAVGTSRLAGRGRADTKTVSAILEGALRARGQRPEAANARPLAYRPDCINASADVEAIARRLSSSSCDHGGVPLLLHGLPGTGKSEWVQELGRRLARPLLARRASDIESKWIGESEQNLARAFREATERGAVLLFDEVDSFLLDRRGASWRHELQLTNEFLQQLETFRGVVACTTNLLDRLDPAVLRRFPIKVEFRPATAAQAAALFESYFASILGTDALARVRAGLPALLGAAGALTPGDFAAVARRALVTGEVRTPEDAVRLLREEVSLRPNAGGRPVGFAPERGGAAASAAPPRLAEAATLDRGA